MTVPIVLTGPAVSAAQSVYLDGTVYSLGTSVEDVDLSDQYLANYAIEWIDAAIEQVANYRANVGSALNRFGMTISNLRHTVENLEASRSRVRDTDFATEYSNVAKRRVLLESRMTVLQKATY